MFLYSLTLQKATGSNIAVVGSFSAQKTHELAVSRGKVLELWSLDDSGRFIMVAQTEVFGLIRMLVPFRLTGGTRDYLLATSDSGRLSLLEFDGKARKWVTVHQETFGKSGCRRIVPGQFAAVDPRGRACMIAAVEKQKFVYILNRDSSARLTISSPLEAHKGGVICYGITGLDVGYDNPLFAAIELDYSDADADTTGEALEDAQKELVIYELDLGLNHTSRKMSSPIDNGANMLISVPGGDQGPGGVLICCENFVIYKPVSSSSMQMDSTELRTVIPRRAELTPERGILLISSATHRSKSMFFFLAQSEYGDVYKIILVQDGEGDGGGNVVELRMSYFDTIPPSASLCLFKLGFLYSAAEMGNHALYQIIGLGDEEEIVSSSSALEETDEGFKPVFFRPRRLKNLMSLEDIDSLAPITSLVAAELYGEETRQLYALCGRGSRSTLRVLRPGLAVTEIAAPPLPGSPTNVWTVKRSSSDDYDAYIVVSFLNATLVLSIGDTVEEVPGSTTGFLDTVPSLSVSLLGENSLLQIHPDGMRHVRGGGEGDPRVNEWRPMPKLKILKASVNSEQVAIALTSYELIYFELDISGQLMELEKTELGAEIACIDLVPPQEGERKSKYMAVGCHDFTIKILSVSTETLLQQLATQMVPAPPESCLFVSVEGIAGGADTLYLNIGLSNGVLMRAQVDPATARLSDIRTRFLGSRAVKLTRVVISSSPAVLALSVRPWVGFQHLGRFGTVPLSYDALEAAAPFTSEQCAEGIVAVAGDTLRIITLDRLSDAFNATITPLAYTGRRLVVNEQCGTICVIEGDHASLSKTERNEMRAQLAEPRDVKMEDGNEEEEEDDGVLPEEQLGELRKEPGLWSSCVRIVDAANGETTSIFELGSPKTIGPDQCAVSLCLCRLAGREDYGQLLAVGCVRQLSFYPRRHAGGVIHIFRFENHGKVLNHVHSTEVDGIPYALSSLEGRLIAGVGRSLRLYEMGRKKLLKKTEERGFPSLISCIQTKGSRIYVADQQQGFFCCLYRRQENRIYVFADETAPSQLIASKVLDYDTIAGADRFGNIYISRLPEDVSDRVDDDPSSGAADVPLLNGCPFKMEKIVHTHIGDVAAGLTVATLQAEGTESIIYGTLMGGIGALVPLATREEVDLVTHLEMHMRVESPPLLGREHLAFRSFYAPVKSCLDGDLCEQYTQLPAATQRRIAEELDREPGEIVKKLEDIRARII